MTIIYRIKNVFRLRQFFLKIKGISMLPVLFSEDIVYFNKTYFNRLKNNDVILVKKNHHYFTHRIIYKIKSYLITKGDNNLLSDGKIYPSQVIAKAIKIKRQGKTINIEDLYLFQSTLYFQEVVKIKKALEKENVDFVFLKGLPLHLFFESSHPKRIYADCDVLVDKKDFDKAEKILLTFGYKKVRNDLSPTQGKLKNKEIEASFLKIINGIPVVFDIHIEPVFLMIQLGSLDALYPQKLIDQLTYEFLTTKQQIIINHEKFYILNTKYLILYLALHFFHHNFRGAFRLDFLDTVIRKSHLKKQDWIDIKTTINDYYLENYIGPVFFLLKKYYSTSVPDFINFKSFINYKNLNIFDDESRLEAGVNRFKNIFFLSPRPLIIRVFVFFNPQVIYLVFFALKKKLSYFLSKH